MVASASAKAPSVDRVRATLHRLFIDAADTLLRKEDEKKCVELTGMLARLARLKKGAHLVDAAAGKASVGLVAAELLPLGRLTVLERDLARVVACRSATTRLSRDVRVEIWQADLADAPWPQAPDAVVALHACGAASDRVVEGVIACGARSVFLVPCCYGEAILARARAFAFVPAWFDRAADEPLRRRILSGLVDMERTLRLEAAGFQTWVEELVAPTVTPHNLLLCGRRTRSAARMERAVQRLAELRGTAQTRAPVAPSLGIRG